MITDRATRRRWPAHGAAALAVLLLAAPFRAQAPESVFQPRIGQPGKDVIWVPTPPTLVEKMLDLVEVTEGDTLVDLGSGDGRLVIAAARRGARAVGIEFNHDMVELSRQRAAREGLADRVRFIAGDLFAQDLSEATIVTMFLLPEINLALRERLLRLKPGTRLVSNTFDMGAWVPDTIAAVGGDCVVWCTALLWVVPAEVGGTWQSPQGTLALRQEFQLVSGTLTQGSAAVPLEAGRLLGDRLTLHAGAVDFVGRVGGDIIEGTATSSGATVAWVARRVAR
jgi:SAM-dependent methyltransferase